MHTARGVDVSKARYRVLNTSTPLTPIRRKMAYFVWKHFQREPSRGLFPVNILAWLFQQVLLLQHQTWKKSTQERTMALMIVHAMRQDVRGTNRTLALGVFETASPPPILASARASPSPYPLPCGGRCCTSPSSSARRRLGDTTPSADSVAVVLLHRACHRRPVPPRPGPGSLRPREAPVLFQGPPPEQAVRRYHPFCCRRTCRCYGCWC